MGLRAKQKLCDAWSDCDVAFECDGVGEHGSWWFEPAAPLRAACRMVRGWWMGTCMLGSFSHQRIVAAHAALWPRETRGIRKWRRRESCLPSPRLIFLAADTAVCQQTQSPIFRKVTEHQINYDYVPHASHSLSKKEKICIRNLGRALANPWYRLVLYPFKKKDRSGN